MSLRTIVVILILIIGAAFLAPSNPYTDAITKPIIHGLGKVSSYLNNKKTLPTLVEKSRVEKNKVEQSKVYKWQDKEGKWHFTNTKPPKDVAAQSEIYRSDTNVIPAIKPKK